MEEGPLKGLIWLQATSVSSCHNSANLTQLHHDELNNYRGCSSGHNLPYGRI